MVPLDPSTSSISTPIKPIPSEQPHQVEVNIITYMDNDLFKAAEDGDMVLFDKYQGGLHCLVDKRQNTALHIYSRTGGRQVVKSDKRFLRSQKMRFEREYSKNFVDQLVDMCPSLLLQPNDRGEVPLHVAAKHGHLTMVEDLIKLAKKVPQKDLEEGLEATCSLQQMLGMRDKDGNTALHMAVEGGDVRVVRLLVKESDPDFSFYVNKSGETPLYVATKTKRNCLVAEILDNCKSIDYGGPDGRTTLHAAVMASDEKSVKKLIEANKHLTNETDANGWTPLHYAAKYDCYSITKLLLEADASTACITHKDRGITALHIAACRGNKAIMEEIISHFPGCCEILDKKRRNFLHFAVLNLDPEKLERFLLDDGNKIKDLPIRNLVNEKDVNGNTPFHLLIFGHAYRNKMQVPGNSEVVKFFERHGSEDYLYMYRSSDTEKKKQIRQWLKDIANDAKVAGLPIRFFRKIMEEEEEEEDAEEAEEDIQQHEILEKARDSHLVVATLIATVTFTAAFTVPGGYNDRDGTATLIHGSAFKAFVITNTLAFVFSFLAIFLHFHLVVVPRKYFKDIDQPGLFLLADLLTFLAMQAMAIAFGTGIYAVLQSSLGIAITALCLSLIFYVGSGFSYTQVFENKMVYKS